MKNMYITKPMAIIEFQAKDDENKIVIKTTNQRVRGVSSEISINRANAIKIISFLLKQFPNIKL